MVVDRITYLYTTRNYMQQKQDCWEIMGSWNGLEIIYWGIDAVETSLNRRLFSRGLQGLESALQWKRIEWPAEFSVAERAVSLDMSNPLNTERLTFARGGVFRPSGDENGMALRAAS